MAGNSAVLSGSYGKGRVILVSPHIESSTDATTATLFCNLFRHAAACPARERRPKTDERRDGRRSRAGSHGTQRARGAARRARRGRAAGRAPPLRLRLAPTRRRLGLAIDQELPAMASTAARRRSDLARLYEDGSASVVLGEGAGSSARVVGVVLGCADLKTFAARLRKADEIEGYLPRGGGRCERAVVEVRLEEGGTVAAYVHHRPMPTSKRAKRVWSGDWLTRHCASEGKRPAETSGRGLQPHGRHVLLL